MGAFISLENVSYAYPGYQGVDIPALRDVTLRVAKGEYVALAGANGSGKSTLARMLNALLIPDNGLVTISSLDTRDPQQHLFIRRTVGMVFQRPEDQMIASTIESDVAFGPENIAVPADEIRARVRQALDSVGMWSFRHRRPDQVSAGQMQRVALAGVLAMHPKCIVFDEATAMLDPSGRKSVRDSMKNLHAEGMTIINITHFMDEALDADRLVVLDQGHVVMDGKPSAVFQDAGTLRSVGLDLPPAGRLAERLRNNDVPIRQGIFSVSDLVTALGSAGCPDIAASPDMEKNAIEIPIISVNNLDYTYMPGTPSAQQALFDVDLNINQSTPHGLMGPTGAGKSTLLQHLNGLLRPQSGDVSVFGANLSDPATDLRAVRRKVGLVFQIPESQMFEQYVGDEIAYGPHLAGIEGEELRQRVRWAMTLVGLDFDKTKDRPSFALSGGEKRKVALASILALQPAILLLDEPTAGLDPRSRRELLNRLAELKTEMTLVISSHQMEDLAVLVDELSVLSAGSIIIEGETSTIFSQRQRLLDLGLDVPVVVQVVHGLKELGWQLPDGIVKDEQLADYLKDCYG